MWARLLHPLELDGSAETAARAQMFAAIVPPPGLPHPLASDCVSSTATPPPQLLVEEVVGEGVGAAIYPPQSSIGASSIGASAVADHRS